MLPEDQRQALLGEIGRLAFEATSPESLAQSVMAPLERLLDVSSSVFYRINEHGHFVPIAGTLSEAGYEYSRHYYEVDPLQRAMREANSWVFRTDRYPSAWREFLNGPVYLEHCHRYDIHSYVNVRLVDSDHGAIGTYGIMLARGEHQPGFSSRDEFDLIELLPTFEAAVRRGVREGTRSGASLALAAVLDSQSRPTIVLDARGGLVWASKHARRLLGWDRRAKAVVPRALYDGALRLGGLIAGERASVLPRTSVSLVGLDGEKISVALRLARTDVGTPVIVAEFEIAHQPTAAALATRFSLTPTQASVLVSLTHGLSDRAIAEQHKISLATVRSHLGQVLSKLGVESRLQAALLVARSDAATDDDDPPPVREADTRS
jgi:DNA-binding CsgD family transcriptional regulator